MIVIKRPIDATRPKCRICGGEPLDVDDLYCYICEDERSDLEGLMRSGGSSD